MLEEVVLEGVGVMVIRVGKGDLVMREQKADFEELHQNYWFLLVMWGDFGGQVVLEVLWLVFELVNQDAEEWNLPSFSEIHS